MFFVSWCFLYSDLSCFIRLLLFSFFSFRIIISLTLFCSAAALQDRRFQVRRRRARVAARRQTIASGPAVGTAGRSHHQNGEEMNALVNT